MSTNDGDRSGRTRPDAEPTPFEQPARGGRKPGGRGRLPVGVLAAIFFGLLVALAVVLVVAATGGHGNGQTTSMAPLAVALLS